jgi:hypothetical protein
MAANTKKCPMCAEEIPAEVTVCPYCDTQLVGEAQPSVSPQQVPLQGALPAAKPKRTGLVIGLVVAGLAILAIVGAIIRAMTPGGNAGLSRAGATSTHLTQPSLTPNSDATHQAYIADTTAEARNIWVQGFAEPILVQIENRSPDFSDDFSNRNRSYSQWNVPPEFTINQGVAQFTVDGEYAYAGLNGPLTSNNFVLEFELSPQSIANELWLGVGFRSEEQEYNHFTISIGQSPEIWYGFGKNDAQGQPGILEEGTAILGGVGKTIMETVIVRGDQAVLYLNDQPMLFTRSLWTHGNFVSIDITTVSGKSIGAIDNVRFWDLNK